MSSENYSGEIAGEQIAEQFHEMIQETVDSWVSNEDSEAHREGRYICIPEEELVENILVMTAMTISEFSED